MKESGDSRKLIRCWVHSHEEDRSGRIVLRTESYAFPPARLRKRLALEPGGAAAVPVPGPDDRLTAGAEPPGTWILEGDTLRIRAPGWTGVYTVERLERDLLVIVRQKQGGADA